MSKRPLKFFLRSADKIFFLHIPKSAGTTFYSILAKNFPTDKVWPIGDEGLLARLIEKGPESVTPYRLLRAHYDYSVYKYLPRKPVYVTMLRNPIRRVISYYQHVKRVPTHKLHNKVVEDHVSLQEFLDPPMAPSETMNYQVRALAGVVKNRTQGLSDRALLEIARVRLDEFAFFGLVEFFDESIRLLHYTFGWESIHDYQDLNVAPLDPSTSEHDDEVIELIEHLNQLDVALYRYAKTLFNARMKQMELELERGPEEQSAGNQSLDDNDAKMNDEKSITKTDRMSILGTTATTHKDLGHHSHTLATLGKIRRWIVPEGCKIEKRYLQIRRRLLGW